MPLYNEIVLQPVNMEHLYNAYLAVSHVFRFLESEGERCNLDVLQSFENAQPLFCTACPLLTPHGI